MRKNFDSFVTHCRRLYLPVFITPLPEGKTAVHMNVSDSKKVYEVFQHFENPLGFFLDVLGDLWESHDVRKSV